MTLGYNQNEGGKSQTTDAIRAWLVAKLSELLDVTPESIDLRESFTSYGLGSLQAVIISGELGDWLGRKLSPTLAYDYPNVEVLARYLAEELAVGNRADRHYRDELPLSRRQGSGRILATIARRRGCHYGGS